MSKVVNSMHRPSDMLRAIGLDDARRTWPEPWESQRTFPGELNFLSPSFVQQACDFLRMPDELRQVMLRSARSLAQNGSIRPLMWHCRWLMFEPGGVPPKSLRDWPMMPPHLGEPGRMFYALLYTSAVPLVRRVNAARCIPESITIDTLRDLELWIHEHRRRHGEWGFSERDWPMWHFTGRLFLLGRLQFQLDYFPHDLPGFPVKKNQPVLAVHIPATGPMDPAACNRSFALACDFFPRHFPEHQFAAFTCESWLLDPQLANCLPPTSNIVRFMNRWRHYDLTNADDSQLIERVFDRTRPDLRNPPQGTALQRAIIEHMRKGVRFQSTGGVIPV